MVLEPGAYTQLLKSYFCRKDHGSSPRAGRKLVDLKSELCLLGSHVSAEHYSPLVMLEIQNPEGAPSPGRDLTLCMSWQVSGLALQS